MLNNKSVRGHATRHVARNYAITLPALAVALSILVALCATMLVACSEASIPTPTCGTVAVNHLGTVSGAQAAQAETCFYQGFQQCKVVSIGLSHMTGVDTATESIFSVQSANGGACEIAKADFDLMNTSETATATAICTGLSQENGGLLITSCSSGRGVSIPAPTPATSSPTPAPSRSTWRSLPRSLTIRFLGVVLAGARAT